MDTTRKLQISLLSLRIGVFIVMFMWTIDKFIDPEHASRVFSKFYSISGLENYIFYLIGFIQLIILFAFVLGIKKRMSYGIIFIIHGISTLSSFQQYLNPYTYPNLLFFAAWPMLAACFTLYLLRDSDTLLTIK